MCQGSASGGSYCRSRRKLIRPQILQESRAREHDAGFLPFGVGGNLLLLICSHASLFMQAGNSLDEVKGLLAVLREKEAVGDEAGSSQDSQNLQHCACLLEDEEPCSTGCSNC